MAASVYFLCIFAASSNVLAVDSSVEAVSLIQGSVAFQENMPQIPMSLLSEMLPMAQSMMGDSSNAEGNGALNMVSMLSGAGGMSEMMVPAMNAMSRVMQGIDRFSPLLNASMVAFTERTYQLLWHEASAKTGLPSVFLSTIKERMPMASTGLMMLSGNDVSLASVKGMAASGLKFYLESNPMLSHFSSYVDVALDMLDPVLMRTQGMAMQLKSTLGLGLENAMPDTPETRQINFVHCQDELHNYGQAVGQIFDGLIGEWGNFAESLGTEYPPQFQASLGMFKQGGAMALNDMKQSLMDVVSRAEVGLVQAGKVSGLTI